MPLVHLPVVEIVPVLKNWLTQLGFGNEIVKRCVKIEGCTYPCLCLKDELEIQDCLSSKLGGENARRLLKKVLKKGRFPRKSVNFCIDGLVDMEIIYIEGGFILKEPLLEIPQVRFLLKLD